MKKILFLIVLSTTTLFSQNDFFKHENHFTRQDSLRGSITPQRAWWDVQYYDLDVQVFPKKKSIIGSNTISFRVLKPTQKMQIDLQEPMQISKVVFNHEELHFTREGHVFWIDFNKNLPIHSTQKITIHFKGNPRVALRAPWDGGLTWNTDANGIDFIATANQGIGASIWWPNKDHDYDEPDHGTTISVTVPEHLTDVSNGRLIEVIDHPKDATKTFVWKVQNPINNYGINLNIGDYVHFSEVFQGEKGPLDCNYWVLRDNLEKAKKQFKQAKMTLQAFEHWFGPYPFYEDSYKLVEAPYLGMEHQSSVTYGNQYKNGYLGRDLSGTGIGLKFDFIIVHESGHEWFANNITNKDVADMWIHESFTAYSESLYLDYHFGTADANKYIIGTRNSILNDRPLVGVYNVNYSGSGDMYYKGANMLHTIRQMINNDEQWRNILRGLNKTFYHQQVTTKQIENYISEQSGLNLNGFFNQYLRTIIIPALSIQKCNHKITFQFKNTVANFSMPIKVYINNKATWVTVNNTKTVFKSDTKIKTLTIDENFYITVPKKYQTKH